MSDGVQTTYRELANLLVDLPLLLREARRTRQLSLRAAAREIGCSFNTIARIEKGDFECRTGSAVSVLIWLDGPR